MRLIKTDATARLETNLVARQLDTYSLFRALLDDMAAERPRGRRPAFSRQPDHRLADMALRFSKKHGVTHVALSGGVMQNLTFAQELPAALAERGLLPLTHKQLPPNDGCISLGQAAYGQRC